MRFIAKNGAYRLPFRRHITEWDDRVKDEVVKQQGIHCIFEQGTLTDFEVETAISALGPFNGLPTYADEVTPVSPRSRLSVYDTDEAAQLEGWDEKTKTAVEEFLLNHPLSGRDHVLVAQPRRPKPWPKYDTLTGANAAKLIAKKTVEDGYDPEQVAAYERENLDRDDVLAALADLLPSEQAEELIEA